MQPRWWWVVVCALSAVAALWYARESHLRRLAMARADALAVTIEQDTGVRPRLGRDVGGDDDFVDDAWHHYEQALAVAPGDPDGFALKAALLHRGAASRTVRYPDADVRDGFELAAPDVLAYLDLGRGLIGQAKTNMASGRAAEALAVLFDTAVLGRDLADTGTLVSHCAGCLLIDEAVYAMAAAPLRTLSRAECQSLAVRLEQLEGLVPGIDRPLRMEAAGIAFSLLGRRPELDAGTAMNTWAWLCAGSAVIAQQEFLAELEVASRLSWPAARKRAEAAAAALKGSANPVVRLIATPSIANHLSGSRQAVARIRALREILHHQAFGRRLELDDPFGDGALEFAVLAETGGVACRSRGPDGDRSLVVEVK